MKNLSGVVQQLKEEREGLQKQVQRIDSAIAALMGANSNGTRTMSAEARRRISLAQKARWSKFRMVCISRCAWRWEASLWSRCVCRGLRSSLKGRSP